MDELFRFVALRPPAAESKAIVVDGDSPLAVRLAAARGTPGGREQMQQLAQSFVQSNDFVRDAASLNLTLDQLADALDDADGLDRSSVGDLVERSLGSEAGALIDSPEFAADLARLHDSALALKLAATDDADVASVLRLLGAADAVQGVAAGRDVFSKPAERLIQLPGSVFPLPAATAAVVPAAVAAGPSAEQVQKDLVAHAKELNDAILALGTAEKATIAAVAKASAASTFGDPKRVEGVEPRMHTSVSVSPQTSAIFLDASAARLPAPVQRVLSNFSIDVESMAVPAIVHILKKELGTTESQITPGYGSFGPYNPLTEPLPRDDANDPKPALLTEPPKTHGTVKPAGVADLLVVRQHVLGYAAGEVAYVENVAKGEKLVRTTQRADTIEDISVTIAESLREQQRDVQATDRFDLRTESSEVLKSDSARTPGSAASAAYGVLVETGNSSEQAQRAAETFGRDIATRAVSRVAERFRTEVTHRRVQEFKEEVRHEFDNSTGAAHETVVYQWLDRVIQAQVFTFGTRTFYDFVVPEPAALLLRAAAVRRAPDGPLVKPAPFTLKPSQINDVNYFYYTAGYGVTGVTPPPDPQKVVAESFANNSQNKYSDRPELNAIHQAVKAKLTIPPGYRAVSAEIRGMGALRWTEEACFGISVGNTYLDLSPTSLIRATLTLSGEVGFLPVTLVNSEGDGFYAVNVEVWCEPTERAMDEWRQHTWDQILQASRQRLQEYEERAANLRAALRSDSLNFSIERKRATEREELERACLEILTNQHFDGLSAIEHSSGGFPQPFLPNVEPLGRYVRFFQQAFEWEQMTWRSYPYFWARKTYWLDKMLLDDNDPQFRDFLRAGSARVLLPVRPGFEGAVSHFMETGIVPTVEELGQMASLLYLPYVAEALAADVAIETAKPYGKPWQLRAPTALVKLRASQTMPNWTSALDADGRLVWSDGAGDPF